MSRVPRKLPPMPETDRLRNWHLDAVDSITRQHVERIAKGMPVKESLLFMLRSLKLHKREMNCWIKENRIMLSREAEALKLDRSRTASSDVQY